MMKEECLICGAPLEYLETDEMMECAVCRKKEPSKTRCVSGHYVCDACHTAGMDSLIGLCLEAASKDPIEIINSMMAQPFCHMHGPEHHAGMFVSIISKSTPLSAEPFGLSNLMTSKALERIGAIGGPRCCKRDSFLSILAAVDFVRENFGIDMARREITCGYAAQNNQCIGKRCPFSKPNHESLL